MFSDSNQENKFRSFSQAPRLQKLLGKKLSAKAICSTLQTLAAKEMLFLTLLFEKFLHEIHIKAVMPVTEHKGAPSA